MKWSQVLHTLTVIVGMVGFVALLGAWVAGEAGEFAGFSQEHLFEDAQSLFLLAILFGLGTRIHQVEEGKK